MALAIDYRNYGESGGSPRQFEDLQGKSLDLATAAEFLAARPDTVGREVGLLGICTSGGTVMYAAPDNPHVGAVATVAGLVCRARDRAGALRWGGRRRREKIRRRRGAGEVRTVG